MLVSMYEYFFYVGGMLGWFAFGFLVVILFCIWFAFLYAIASFHTLRV